MGQRRSSAPDGRAPPPPPRREVKYCPCSTTIFPPARVSYGRRFPRPIPARRRGGPGPVAINHPLLSIRRDKGIHTSVYPLRITRTTPPLPYKRACVRVSRERMRNGTGRPATGNMGKILFFFCSVSISRTLRSPWITARGLYLWSSSARPLSQRRRLI